MQPNSIITSPARGPSLVERLVRWLHSLWATTGGKVAIGVFSLVVVGGGTGAVLFLTSQRAASPADDNTSESTEATPETSQNPSAAQDKPATETKDQPKTSTPTPAKPGTSTQQSGTGTSTTGGGTGQSGGSSGGVTCSGALHTVSGSDGMGGCWPGPSSTGVPAGVTLSTYSGPSTITTNNTVIDGKLINADVRIQASNVIIRNSKINGYVDVDGPSYSLTMEDVEVDASTWSNAAIGFSNVTLKRVNAHGGITSVNCGTNCTILDSYLHGQKTPTAAEHEGGYLSNGGDNVLLRHNYIVCDVADNASGGGCSGTAQIYGDFSNNTNFTFDKNLFGWTPGGYCTSFGHNPGKPFGDNPANITVTNNIWQRGPTNICAAFGATTSFLAANGNIWSNNKYADGAVLNP